MMVPWPKGNWLKDMRTSDLASEVNRFRTRQRVSRGHPGLSASVRGGRQRRQRRLGTWTGQPKDARKSGTLELIEDAKVATESSEQRATIGKPIVPYR